LFGAKHVFDFSMGWGDRLAGFHASNAETYYGTDPNVAVYKNYKKQDKFYNTKKKTVFKNSPAEDLDLSNEKFDMIFTSPPYFNVEEYSTDETQSYKRYGTDIELWLKDFLFATIDKCWNSLEDGGTMIINISDIFKNGKLQKICDPMNDYISKLPKAHYTGCTGLRLSKRPNSKTSSPEARNKQSVEPIWIWKKNDKRTLEQIIENNTPLNKFWRK
jgi:DNA modification methylase